MGKLLLVCSGWGRCGDLPFARRPGGTPGGWVPPGPGFPGPGLARVPPGGSVGHPLAKLLEEVLDEESPAWPRNWPPPLTATWCRKAYRRKWATERKHLSDTDVAAAGGWQNSLTLKKVYQQSDAETILQVVLGGGELRERKA